MIAYRMFSMDSTLEIISKAQLPADIKKVLACEIKYYYANQFRKFENGWLTLQYTVKDINRQYIESGYDRIVKSEIAFFQLPDYQDLESSQSAKVWMGLKGYGQIKYEILLRQMLNDTAKTGASNAFQQAVGMSQQQEQQLRSSYGDGYVYVLQRANLLPPYAAVRWLADEIYLSCEKLRDPGLAGALLRYLTSKYPGNPYNAACSARIEKVTKLKSANMSNAQIHIHGTVGDPVSLDELVGPYLGKTVFIDLWGTWCYPCVKEFDYMPAIKTYFADSGLVFVYIDRDEDKDDERWKDYIYTHDLAGEHYRLTPAQIDRFWPQISPGNKKQSYPRYVIVDAKGHLAIPDALRPSKGQELYDQVSMVLRKVTIGPY
jgi:thiol-disulfide isomerase/thioredoxin